jgi:diguanylate cyclase (GGDEF)-like protein
VVGVSLDPRHFSQFYDSINVGRDGTIRVVGTDGIVRALGRQGGTDTDYVGKSLSGSTLLTRARSEPAGWYYSPSGRSDQIQRLVFYRVVEGFPLIVAVGLGEQETFRGVLAKRNAYNLTAALVTVLILIVMSLSMRDRMQLERASGQLRVQNLRFDAALNNMPQGLSMVDAEQKLVVCNSAYARMFHLSPEEVRPGATIAELLKRKIARGCQAPTTPAEYALERLSHRSRIEHLPDQRDLLVLSQPIDGGGWVTTYEDVTERLQNEARITHMARHDALTNLGNRTLFLERLEQALKRPGEPFAIFMLDLDRFKVINDTLGHCAGDTLLQQVARRLRLCTQASDTLARLGGDEFAVLHVGGADQRADAALAAAKIIETLSQPYEISGQEVLIGTSIGIALAPEDGSSTEQLLRNSDLALYQSKLEGRNGYCFFQTSMETQVQMRRTLERELRHALARNEFELHYQPVFDVATRAWCGMEALVRWNRGPGRMVGPAEFIPLAEDIGLIVPIGKWVLGKACRDAMAWPKHIKVAVNLSSAQFGRSRLVDSVAEALADSELPPHRLELEITETVLLESSENNLKILRSLKALGASIVLDDFGIGYSSLSYLSMFTFDKIKIDRSFVAELTNRSDCAAIVSSIINLGRSLNLTTVAEGVETEQQLAMLCLAGCSQVQGYLFGRPLPADQIDTSKWQHPSGVRDIAAA